MVRLSSRILSTAVAVFLLGVVPSFASCEAACKEARAIWKTRVAINIDGTKYLVALSPDKTFALVRWDKGVKMTSVAAMEKAGSSVSKCVAKDTSILAFVQGDRATPIATNLFKNVDYLRFDLSC